MCYANAYSERCLVLQQAGRPNHVRQAIPDLVPAVEGVLARGIELDDVNIRERCHAMRTTVVNLVCGIHPFLDKRRQELREERLLEGLALRDG